jgi:hypothetical protein
MYRVHRRQHIRASECIVMINAGHAVVGRVPAHVLIITLSRAFCGYWKLQHAKQVYQVQLICLHKSNICAVLGRSLSNSAVPAVCQQVNCLNARIAVATTRR